MGNGKDSNKKLRIDVKIKRVVLLVECSVKTRVEGGQPNSYHNISIFLGGGFIRFNNFLTQVCLLFCMLVRSDGMGGGGGVVYDRDS